MRRNDDDGYDYTGDEYIPYRCTQSPTGFHKFRRRKILLIFGWLSPFPGTRPANARVCVHCGETYVASGRIERGG